jgi:hypothetical protein
MALGLLLSAVVGGVDRAATVLPVILVVQVIVSVPIISGSSVVLQVMGYGLSARWGMAAAASTIDLADLRKPYITMTETARSGRVVEDLTPYEQPTWKHDPAVWGADVAILLALTVVGLAGAWLALRATDPDLMEGRHKRRRVARRPPPDAPSQPPAPAPRAQSAPG